MSDEVATAIPRSPVSVSLRMRQHVLVQDKLPHAGGKDEGPMASEFLLGSLLACQHSTLVKVAVKRRMTVTVRAIEGTMRFDAAGDIGGIDLAFDLDAPGATDEAIATLLRLTEAACTISKALKVPVTSTRRSVTLA